ncbi:hypothetical protein O6H91_17G034300 [Diphasiastrum complanatum]|uniref:Uncharacterized protein n=2 Tax=Diphasiastrum complanatum TaxID=34168 RepID=A0ACC2B5N8_DIPCM|nr:hypothetical protein O6H91_17G034300 [Diphasiastrum complanatum]KAJ7525053.1 hypothetical protein O6H91_17G034300 [Diphasiastrum complanatum]
MMAVANPAIVVPSFRSSTAVRQGTVSLMRCRPRRSGLQMNGMMILRPPAQKSAYLRPSSIPLRVASSDEASSDTSNQFEETLEALKAKWETLENKSSIATYSAGAIAVAWFSSTLIGVISPVPLLPKLMELVGLGYSSWFVYRYLLFKANREELNDKISNLKEKIIGTANDEQM